MALFRAGISGFIVLWLESVAISALKPTGLGVALTSRMPPVRIDLFYETLCPSCQRFITAALAPVWRDPELRQRIDLHVFPYGNAQTLPIGNVSEGYRVWHPGTDYVYVCQHGTEECFGNMIQACAMDLLDIDVYMPFIICMEDRSIKVSQESSSYDCAMDQGLNIKDIQDCTEGFTGNQLMRSVGEDTKRLRDNDPLSNKTYVPWLLLQGKHSTESEIDADDGNSGHFVDQLCKLLEAPKPAACTKNVVVTAPEETTTQPSTQCGGASSLFSPFLYFGLGSLLAAIT